MKKGSCTPIMLEENTRTQLREAVKKLKLLGKGIVPKVFTWNGQLADSVLAGTKAIYVNGPGLVDVMNLPLECDDLVRLAHEFSHQKGKHCSVENVGSYISASQITLIPAIGGMTQQQLLQDVTYETLEDMLNIDFDFLGFSIESKLEGLVICQEEESYHSALSTRDKLGKFGTLFLQIPLNVDKPCGSILIYDRTEETSMEFDDNGISYSFAAVAGGFSIDAPGTFKIRSETGQVTVVMIFSLVWNDYLTFKDLLPVECFSELLVLTNDIKEALVSWHSHSPQHSDTDDSADNSVTSLKMLCLPISSPFKDGFSDFNLEDMIVAQSLMQIAFIDIQLACLEPYEKKKSCRNNGSSVFCFSNRRLGPWFCFKKSSQSKILKMEREKFQFTYKSKPNLSTLKMPTGATFDFGTNSLVVLDWSASGVNSVGMISNESEAKTVPKEGLQASVSGANNFLFGANYSSTASAANTEAIVSPPLSFSTTVSSTNFGFGNVKFTSSIFESPVPSTGKFGTPVPAASSDATTASLSTPPAFKFGGTQPGLFSLGSASASNAFRAQAVSASVCATSSPGTRGSVPFPVTTTTSSQTPVFLFGQQSQNLAQTTVVTATVFTAKTSCTTVTAPSFLSGFNVGQTTTATITRTGTTSLSEVKPATARFSSTAASAPTTQSATSVIEGFGMGTTGLFGGPGQASLSPGGPTSALTPKQASKTDPVVVTDDIFYFHFSTNDYVISDIAPCDFSRVNEDVSIPAIVVRPRIPRRLVIDNKICQEKLVPEDLLCSVEERLEAYVTKGANQGSPIHCSLLKDLQQIVDLLKQDVTPVACNRCFFSRLFNVCVWLEAKDEALELLRQVLGSCLSVKKWFVCIKDACRPNTLDPAASFADFIKLTNGWDTCRDVLKQLMSQLVTEDSFHVLSDVGLHLLHIGYVAGARETFEFTLKAATTKFKSHEFSKIFHARLIVLAIHLQKDEPHGNVMDTMLMSNLQSHQITELAEHLGKLNSTSFNCKPFMKTVLGVVVKFKLCFFKFDPDQFFKILRVYDSLQERDLVKSFWSKLCAQCIETFKSNTDLPCLFCNMLRRSTSFEARGAIVWGLIGVPEAKEAVVCSVRQLVTRRGGVHLPDVIDVVQQLQDVGVLSMEEVTDHLMALVSRMSIEEIGNMSCSLLTEKRSMLNNRSSIVRTIYDYSIERVAHFVDWNTFNKIDQQFLLLRGLAWLGSPCLFKTFLVKLETSGKYEVEKKFTLMLGALKADWIDFSTASLMTLSRETFNCLMLECVKALGHLDYRIFGYIECFKQLAAAERNFIDSTEEHVLSQWLILTQSLGFLETVEAVTAIFEAEIINEGPCLKKFPPCWQVFTKLCSNVISKWDLDVVKQRLSESHVVSVMQSFFWIGEETGIDGFCRLIADLPRTVSGLADVHGAIIRRKMTSELATSSKRGHLALNDLIDIRMQILSRRSAVLSAEDYIVGMAIQSEINQLQSLRRDILMALLAGQTKRSS